MDGGKFCSPPSYLPVQRAGSGLNLPRDLSWS